MGSLTIIEPKKIAAHKEAESNEEQVMVHLHASTTAIWGQMQSTSMPLGELL